MTTSVITSNEGYAWFLVRFLSGAVAVVSSEDLVYLFSYGLVDSITRVSYAEACVFESTRARLCPRTVE